MAQLFELPSADVSNVLEISRYLYRMVDRLNSVLSNLNMENMASSYKTSIEKIQSTAEKMSELAGLMEKGEIARTRSVQSLVMNLGDNVNQQIVGVIQGINDVQDDVSGLQTQVGSIGTDVETLQTDVGGLQTNVNGVQQDISTLQTDVSGAQGAIAALQTAQADTDDAISTLQNEDQNLYGELEAQYNALSDAIFAEAEEIRATAGTMIEQSELGIRQYAEQTFIAIDPEMTLEEKIASMIQQSADQIMLSFTQLAEIVDELNRYTAEFGTYFSFTAQGLEIGKVGDGASPIVTRITNERIEFALAGTDVVIAYIDAATNKLNINSADIDHLAIGNAVHGYMDIDMGSNGLMVKWR